MAIEDNLKGSTYAFMTFSPFKAWWGRFAERGILFFAPIHEEATRNLDFLHYAFFTPVSPAELERAGIPTDGTCKHGGLLFVSAYNGDAGFYFRGFSDHVPGAMGEVWGPCRKWTAPKRPNEKSSAVESVWGLCGEWTAAEPRNDKSDPPFFPELDRFIHLCHRPVTAHYNAYPARVVALRRALRARREIDRLAALANTDGDPATFAREFKKVAQVLWSNEG